MSSNGNNTTKTWKRTNRVEYRERPENRFLRQIIKPLGLVKEKKMKERGIWVVQQCNGTSEKKRHYTTST